MFPILPSFTPKTIVDFQSEPDEGALLAKNEADLEYVVSPMIHHNVVITLFPTPFPPTYRQIQSDHALPSQLVQLAQIRDYHAGDVIPGRLLSHEEPPSDDESEEEEGEGEEEEGEGTTDEDGSLEEEDEDDDSAEEGGDADDDNGAEDVGNGMDEGPDV